MAPKKGDKTNNQQRMVIGVSVVMLFLFVYF